MVNGFNQSITFAQNGYNHIWKELLQLLVVRLYVTGTNTKFLTGSSNLKAGDTITIADAGNSTLVLFKTLKLQYILIVAKVAIASDTSLTIDNAFSTNLVKDSNVNLLPDASTPTTFRFDSPVYLQEDQEVAIVLFTRERYLHGFLEWVNKRLVQLE